MASPDPTLLIQDLLSPPDPSSQPATLLQLITYHLSTIPLSTPHRTLISLVPRYTLTAPALWLSTPQSASTDAPKAHWDLHVAVYSSFLHAVLLRLDSISSSSTGTGWSARSAVQTFLNELLAGLWAEPPSGEPENGRGVRPEVRLTVLSGVLAGLQEWKRRKEKFWVGGTKMLGRLESEVGRAWMEWVGTVDGRGIRAAENRLPAWLAAQTLPMVDPNALAKDYPIPDLLAYLSDSFASVFDQGNLFTCPPLSSDLSRTPEGVSWASPSPSHTYLTSITQSPLFVSLGPLSRAIGRTLSAAAQLATSASSPAAEPASSAIHHLSQTILFVSSRLSAGWASTPWSDLLDDAALSPSTRSQTQPWTILKSLLFAQTLLYSSLLEVISNSPSSGEPTKGQRQLAREVVVALGKTYFIASRFGQGGFKTWRAVLAGMVDVAAAASPASARLTGDKVSPAEELVTELEPPEPTGEGGRHDRLVERAEATFWMNTVEQVMDELSDRYVEDRVLAGCRRYLEDATYPEPFESAHSVLLAVFSTGKHCVNDLAPWYTTLLLRAQPDLMSPSQLRFAFSKMVYAVSQTDDALAWWCIRELLAAIDNLPTSTATNAPEPGFVSVDPARPSLRELSDNADGDLRVAPAPVSPPHPFTTAAPTLESRSLSLPRGALLLTSIALLPSINLVLFLSLLSHIERLIRLEPAGSDSRTALAEWVFEVLGTGMDVVKRGEGARWWLEHGEGLIREEKEGDAEEMGGEMEEGVEKVVLDEDVRSSASLLSIYPLSASFTPRQPQPSTLAATLLSSSPDTETVVVEQPPAEPAAVAWTSPAPPAVPSHAAESAPAPAAAPWSPSPSTPIESRSTSSDEAASVLQRHFRRHLARGEALSKLTSLSTSFQSRQSAFSRPPSFVFQSSPSPSSSRSPTPPLAFGAPIASFLASEDFLVNLLSEVDAVASGGDRAIESARKELVRKVEKELARLEAMKERAWEKRTEKASQKEQEADVVEMSPTAEDAQASATLDVPARPAVDSPSPSPALAEGVSPASEPTSPAPAADATPAPTSTPLTAHAVSTLSALAARVSRPPSPAPSDSSATSSTRSVSSGSSAVDACLSEILRSAQKLDDAVARREEAEPVRD
ncbi:hypothetical protein JCM21900_004176 [Sporobolomyces salmonicolor]